jgi:hypothetical protein
MTYLIQYIFVNKTNYDEDVIYTVAVYLYLYLYLSCYLQPISYQGISQCGTVTPVQIRE